MNCTTIEDVLQGREGESEDGISPQLSEAIKDARQDEAIKRLEVECRTRPAWTKRTAQAWTASFDLDTPIPAIVTALQKRSEGNPGSDFSGQIQYNIREKGNTKNKLASHTRIMQGGSDDDEEHGEEWDGEPAEAGSKINKALVDSLIRSMDANVQMQIGSAHMVNANAQVLQSIAGFIKVPEGTAPDGGMLGNLIGGILQTGAANDNMAGRTANLAGNMLAGNPHKQTINPPSPAGVERNDPPAPPSPHRVGTGEQAPNTPTPGDTGGISASQAEAWARANPKAARTMGAKLYTEGL